MTEQHPIIPPQELLKQWEDDWCRGRINHINLLIQAFQTGADQELNACCEYLVKRGHHFSASDLRATHRPKPPSLKEQALEQLDGIATVFLASHGGNLVCDKIRRALETLDD